MRPRVRVAGCVPTRRARSRRRSSATERVALETDDGATILLHYTGLVEHTDALARAAETDGATDWDDAYMRVFMTFDTGAERYAWLILEAAAMPVTA